DRRIDPLRSELGLGPFEVAHVPHQAQKVAGVYGPKLTAALTVVSLEEIRTALFRELDSGAGAFGDHDGAIDPLVGVLDFDLVADTSPERLVTQRLWPQVRRKHEEQLEGHLNRLSTDQRV